MLLKISVNPKAVLGLETVKSQSQDVIIRIEYRPGSVIRVIGFPSHSQTPILQTVIGREVIAPRIGIQLLCRWNGIAAIARFQLSLQVLALKLEALGGPTSL